MKALGPMRSEGESKGKRASRDRRGLWASAEGWHRTGRSLLGEGQMAGMEVQLFITVFAYKL